LKILITSIIDLKKSQHNRPHQFVKYLSNKHDVTVLSINDWWKGGKDNLESYSQEFADIFDRINYSYLTDKKISPILQETLCVKKVNETIKEKFDVHLNYNTLVSGYLASKKINTIYDLADDLSSMIRSSPQIPKILRSFGGSVGDVLLKKNIQMAKLVTVTVDTLATSCQIPSDKYQIIPNGVNTSVFRYLPGAKENLGLNGFIIGYVGVLREWVDLKPVFLALKKINTEIKLLIVGKEGYFEQNLDLAKSCGVADRIIFSGMIPYSQIPKYISAMDVCLIPFKKSGISENALPLKLFEYMACEKPVISTELKGVRKVAGNLVLYVNTIDDLSRIFLELYNDSILRHKLGIAGRKFVEKNYDWSKIVENLEEELVNIQTN
jgi:glycosyltransferase involved in cell wall biosynthesis